MRATFAPTMDIAYLYLTGSGDAHHVDPTEPLDLDMPNGSRRLINLDFDSDRRLVGIEIAVTRLSGCRSIRPRLGRAVGC